MKTIDAWECLRCGHVWPCRGRKKPKKCANFRKCASPFWDKPVVGRWPKNHPAVVSLSPDAGNLRDAKEGHSV